MSLENAEKSSQQGIASAESGDPTMKPSTEFTLVSDISPFFQQIQLTLSRPRANLALLGGFAVMFCSVGYINAFGVFQEFYAQSFLANKSASSISWLGSFNIFCLFGGTLVSGFLNDIYGPRVSLLSKLHNPQKLITTGPPLVRLRHHDLRPLHELA